MHLARKQMTFVKIIGSRLNRHVPAFAMSKISKDPKNSNGLPKSPAQSIEEEDSNYFAFDPSMMKEMEVHPFHRVIEAEKPEDIITEILQDNLTRQEEIRFALHYLTTFDLEKAKINSLDWAKTINYFITRAKDIADDNENLLFFLHCISKLYRSTGIRVNLEQLSDFLNEDQPNVVFQLFSQTDLINISNYLIVVYERELYSFIDFFERKLKSHIIQEIPKFEAGNLISLLILLQSIEYKDPQLIGPLVERSKSLRGLNIKDKLRIVYLTSNIGSFDIELFEDLLSEVLTGHRVKEYTKEDIEDDETLTAEEKAKYEEESMLGAKPVYEIKGTGTAESLSPSEHVEILNILAARHPEKLREIKKIMFLILESIGSLPVENYIDLWLLTSMISKRNSEFVKEPIIAALKQAGLRIPELSFKGLSMSNVSKIMISLSSMKVSDKDLVLFLINLLMNNLAQLKIQEIVHLFRAFYVYSNMFEKFFEILHDNIVKRMDELDSALYDQLREPLKLKTNKFKDSPLVDRVLK